MTPPEETPMDDNQRRDDGMAQRRKVLGNEWVDKSIKNRNAFNTDFQDLITRYAWGDIWTRPHFDHRTRRVLVIGTMVAASRPTISRKSCCSRRSIAACRRPTTR
jgi:alkylhydroperoxidase/carboxymuconolactone decarboxylase family protein YurZ